MPCHTDVLLGRRLDRLRAVLGHAGDLEVLGAAEEDPQRVPHELLVLGDETPTDGLAGPGSPESAGAP
ncbi:hypothetical protein [Mobilicoccus pelagius]|uniref:hypothetical protein n=1 Tax=Mobilicoccus pelagius TaxID=746032 RepID=UPI00145F876D|nr:hypothetical protein [Mobilicoccus pelagius]